VKLLAQSTVEGFTRDGLFLTSTRSSEPIIPSHRKGTEVHTQVCGNAFIFRREGRLVFDDECAVLRERVGSALLGSPNIVVSLCEVDYIDSGGIGVLIGLLVSARNRGGDLKLVAPNQYVTDVLRRTKLRTIFEIYADDDKAVAAFYQYDFRINWEKLLMDRTRRR